MEERQLTSKLCFKCGQKTLSIKAAFVQERQNEYLLELDLNCQNCGYKETKQFKLVFQGPVVQPDIVATPVAMNIPEMCIGDLEDYLRDLVCVVQKTWRVYLETCRSPIRDLDLELSIEIVCVSESQEIQRIREEIAKREMRARTTSRYQVV
jgi:hypothetical protein